MRGDRVLMTADAVGGVWPYVLDLSRGLQDVGLTVDIAVLGPPLSAAQRADAAAAGVRPLEHPGRLEWMDDPWTDVDRAGAWLLDLERALGPDIVHLNGFCHAALPWRAPVIVVGHSCVRSWWRAVHGQAAPACFDEYSRRVCAGLRAADAVVAPTAAMLHELQVEYGAPPQACVIPNGRAFVPDRRVVRQPIVLAAGRVWDEAKNIRALCAAAAEVSWPVFVAGDSRDPDGRATVMSGVSALGALSPAALRTWYGRASIYALPARYEPFGLSVLEAARSGCALVLGDIRSLRENWDDAAVFVPTESPREIAGAIEALIADPARRERLARAATSRAARFTVASMTERYRFLYRQVGARRRRSPNPRLYAVQGVGT